MKRTVSSITASVVEGCMCVWESVCLSEQNIGMLHRGPMDVDGAIRSAKKGGGAMFCISKRTTHAQQGKLNPPPLGTD